MANKRIPLLPDKFYHVYNHGNGDENIFRNEGNYLYFLQKYAEHLNSITYTYAYCLMPNHFHFLVKIKSRDELLNFYKTKYPKKDPQGFQNLAGLNSQQYSNFFNAYTKAFNKQHDRKGSLFLDNFERKEVNNSKYLLNVIYYIHYNPVYHGFVDSVEDWEFSSYHAFLSDKKSHLMRDEVIKWFDDKRSFIKINHQPVDVKKFALEMEFGY